MSCAILITSPMGAEMGLLVAVLAAGRATRFGGGKLDAICAGKPVGRWVIDAVADAGLEQGILVVGPQAPVFAGQAAKWSVLTNPDPAAELGTSLALAAREALMRECNLLVLLADMPLVDPEHIVAMSRSRKTCATRYPSGKPGVPALFSRADLGHLIHLQGEGGAAKVLAEMDGLAMIDALPSSLADVDTAQDLAAAEALLTS